MTSNPQARRISRIVVATIELVLIASAIAMLWMKPFGDTVSVVFGSVITIFFIGLLPALWKGEAGADREKEMIRRGYSDDESPDPYRRR